MSERRRAVRSAIATVALGLALTIAIGGPAPAVVDGGPARQSDEDGQLPVDPAPDPERTRERADEILRGDEYRAPDTRDRSIIDRVRKWISDRLPDLGGGPTGRGLDTLAYVVFGVVVIGGLGAIAYDVARTRGTRQASDGDTDADVDVTPLRTPDEWDAEADRCEREGDHRGAVRARFRALTVTLARRDLVADTPGRTAGELRFDVAERAPTLTPAFGAIADLFERVWFGGQRAGPEQSAAARDLAAAALAAAPRRAAARTDDDEDQR